MVGTRKSGTGEAEDQSDSFSHSPPHTPPSLPPCTGLTVAMNSCSFVFSEAGGGGLSHSRHPGAACSPRVNVLGFPGCFLFPTHGLCCLGALCKGPGVCNEGLCMCGAHSLTHSHSFTLSVSHSHSLTHPHSLTLIHHLFTHPFVHSLTHLFTSPHSHAHKHMLNTCICSLLHSFIHSSIFH